MLVRKERRCLFGREGFAEENPCPCSQTLFSKEVPCPDASTPSATIVSPRPCPNPTSALLLSGRLNHARSLLSEVMSPRQPNAKLRMFP